jgi:hypothetical protein
MSRRARITSRPRLRLQSNICFPDSDTSVQPRFSARKAREYRKIQLVLPILRTTRMTMNKHVRLCIFNASIYPHKEGRIKHQYYTLPSSQQAGFVHRYRTRVRDINHSFAYKINKLTGCFNKYRVFLNSRNKVFYYNSL